jgi:hypothetical protein
MTTCYIKKGASYFVTSKAAMDLHDLLPAANYTIGVTMTGEFFLEKIDSFKNPKKLYGNIKKQTDRILHTFMDRETSTGIMLAGEKGSGKTLLAKNVCSEASKVGVPTIIINAPYHGDVFNKFIQTINQPCIILFDEFEKVYDDEKQQTILTLLDGVFPSKKLFILTSNDKWKLNYHMRNRPGRVFYMLDFNGLSEDFVREYCQDNLNDKTNVDRVCKLSYAFDVFNFDMLKALVEEMNRFNESPQESLLMLNAKPEFSQPVEYEVHVIEDDVPVNKDLLDHPRQRLNPFLQPFNVTWSEVKADATQKEKDDGDDVAYFAETMTPKDLVKIDPKDGKFVFKKNTTMVTLSKVAYSNYRNYDMGLDD